MVTQTGSSNNPRFPTIPVWMCSKCGRKYQTKGQATAHELKVHEK